MEMRGRHRDMSERMGNKTEKDKPKGSQGSGQRGRETKMNTHRESK